MLFAFAEVCAMSLQAIQSVGTAIATLAPVANSHASYALRFQVDEGPRLPCQQQPVPPRVDLAYLNTLPSEPKYRPCFPCTCCLPRLSDTLHTAQMVPACSRCLLEKGCTIKRKHWSSKYSVLTMVPCKSPCFPAATTVDCLPDAFPYCM